MNEISIMETYSKEIENIVALMSQITYDEVSNNLDVLENQILDYLHGKFSNMSVSKDEIHSIIIKLYQTRNFKLKKEVECNLGKAKFECEDKVQSIESIIVEEIEKLRKLFTSVKGGTNYYYLGLVDECTQGIISLLIRWHNSLSFSKDSEQAKEDIRKLISQNYKFIMNNMGDKLLLQLVEPLENKFEFNIDKKMIKQ